MISESNKYVIDCNSSDTNICSKTYEMYPTGKDSLKFNFFEAQLVQLTEKVNSQVTGFSNGFFF